MRFATFLAASSAIPFAIVTAQTTTEPITGTLGNATIVENNPARVVVMARLPEKEFNNPTDPRGNVKGMIMASAGPDGKGTLFTVNFSNLPTSGGPFLYHIHVAPVPEDGNCTKTLGHLDPFIRGETPPCDASLPETCQVGDLSGKYGKIESDPFSVSFVDPFTSIQEGPGSFFGNRSFVVHFANKTRISCGNFEVIGAGNSGSSCLPETYSTTRSESAYSTSMTGIFTSSSSSTTSGTGSIGTTVVPVSGTTSAPPALFTGAASRVKRPIFAVFGAALLGLLL